MAPKPSPPIPIPSVKPFRGRRPSMSTSTSARTPPTRTGSFIGGMEPSSSTTPIRGGGSHWRGRGYRISSSASSNMNNRKPMNFIVGSGYGQASSQGGGMRGGRGRGTQFSTYRFKNVAQPHHLPPPPVHARSRTKTFFKNVEQKNTEILEPVVEEQQQFQIDEGTQDDKPTLVATSVGPGPVKDDRPWTPPNEREDEANQTSTSPSSLSASAQTYQINLTNMVMRPQDLEAFVSSGVDPFYDYDLPPPPEDEWVSPTSGGGNPNVPEESLSSLVTEKEIEEDEDDEEDDDMQLDYNKEELGELEKEDDLTDEQIEMYFEDANTQFKRMRRRMTSSTSKMRSWSNRVFTMIPLSLTIPAIYSSYKGFLDVDFHKFAVQEDVSIWVQFYRWAQWMWQAVMGWSGENKQCSA